MTTTLESLMALAPRDVQLDDVIGWDTRTLRNALTYLEGFAEHAAVVPIGCARDDVRMIEALRTVERVGNRIQYALKLRGEWPL